MAEDVGRDAGDLVAPEVDLLSLRGNVTWYFRQVPEGSPVLLQVSVVDVAAPWEVCGGVTTPVSAF